MRYAHTRCQVNGVGNRRWRGNTDNLADTLGPKGAFRNEILYPQDDHHRCVLHARDRVSGSSVGLDDALIHLELFDQAGPHTHNHPALHLRLVP